MAQLMSTGIALFHTLSLAVLRPWYAARARYRALRVTPAATRLFGPQYARSRNAIEIDITYLCNLRCNNCNRSIAQAPERLHMPLHMVADFVDTSIARNKRWRSIRILGGEPTLHPQFLDILGQLRRYREFAPACRISVVTNGYGKTVNAILKKIPAGIRVENSAKNSKVQPAFGPFNLAPVDDPASQCADYANGCSIMKECGMGLTPNGYYPCAVAGGIDRLLGKRLGYAKLPADADDMLQLSRELCGLCGHFTDGHLVPASLRPALLDTPMSATWVRIYADWKLRRRQRAAEQAG